MDEQRRGIPPDLLAALSRGSMLRRTPDITDSDTATTDQDPRLLAEIDRPYEAEVTLPFGKGADALLVDGGMIFEYRHGQGGRTNNWGEGLWVARKRDITLLHKKNGKEHAYRRRPDMHQDDFGSVFMLTTPKRPQFYIGEQYLVTRVGGDSRGGTFMIASSMPLQTEVIPSPPSTVSYLKALHPSK